MYESESKYITHGYIVTIRSNVHNAAVAGHSVSVIGRSVQMCYGHATNNVTCKSFLWEVLVRK